MPENELRKLLEKLVQSIGSAVDDGLIKGTLQPHYMRYFRWKATEFEYDDTGVKKLSRQGDEFPKPFWNTNDVFQKVSKLDIYSDTYKAISNDYNLREGQIIEYLHQLITRLAANIIEGKAQAVADTTTYIDSFLKDLNGDEQACSAKVELTGLILQPNSIQLANNVKLTKPILKDFETEEPAYFSEGRFSRDPTAFLHISSNAKMETSSVVLRNEIDKAIAIMRLFRVGAVQVIRHTEKTDSVIGFQAGGVTRAKFLGSADKYLITSGDVEVLKRFWANMSKISLPDSAHSDPQKESDALSIAYQRYTDSLDTHLLEKRISSAVMGLEALFLTEVDELPYRLSLRVGKLLSLVKDEYEPNKVRDDIKTAYKIRNKYVHGAILKTEERKKLEEGKFAQKIIDYLRVSIVALLLRKTSKESLIQKIDDSLLDSKMDNKVIELLFMPYQQEV